MRYELLRSQSNQLLELIKESKLEVFNFRWTTSRNTRSGYDTIPKLVYDGTQYYFSFDNYNNSHHVLYSPGKENRQEVQKPGSWEFVEEYFVELGRNTYIEK